MLVLKLRQQKELLNCHGGVDKGMIILLWSCLQAFEEQDKLFLKR